MRGPITNKNNDINWKNKLENFNIDPTLKWEKAEIIELNPNILSLQNEKGENIKIYKSDLNWIIKNKNIDDKFNKGDFIFVKKG